HAGHLGPYGLQDVHPWRTSFTANAQRNPASLSSTATGVNVRSGRVENRINQRSSGLPSIKHLSRSTRIDCVILALAPPLNIRSPISTLALMVTKSELGARISTLSPNNVSQ